jgi:8-oxo-dGTP pyrophosphatase MutT (NUDIX family)
VEPGETVQAAMSREFEEETGMITAGEWWEPMCGIEWPEDDRVDGTRARVDFLRYVYSGALWRRIQTKTDEGVHVVRTSLVQSIPVIPNLRWLVPLACYTADRYAPFTIQAHVAEAL